MHGRERERMGFHGIEHFSRERTGFNGEEQDFTGENERERERT